MCVSQCIYYNQLCSYLQTNISHKLFRTLTINFVSERIIYIDVSNAFWFMGKDNKRKMKKKPPL